VPAMSASVGVAREGDDSEGSPSHQRPLHSLFRNATLHNFTRQSTSLMMERATFVIYYTLYRKVISRAIATVVSFRCKAAPYAALSR
jgi:hypothetical protein